MTAPISAEFLALQELLAGRYSIERELGPEDLFRNTYGINSSLLGAIWRGVAQARGGAAAAAGGAWGEIRLLLPTLS